MTTTDTTEKQPKNTSSVRHTRAIQRDRTKRPLAAPPDEQVAARLTEIVHPATLNQVSYYHQLGLRERTLTLPVMVALVLSLIWRQVGSVCELVRVVRTEVLLWSPPLKMSQQAFSERLRTLPAGLFLRVLLSVLPLLHARWSQRQRPVPPDITWAQVMSGGTWRWRCDQRACRSGNTLSNTRKNNPAGKVRRRSENACWLILRGGAHNSTSVRTTRTNSHTLPTCRQIRLSTSATITGKVSVR